RKYRVGTEDLGLLTVRKFACAGHLHVSAPGTGAVLFRRTAPVPGAATWEGGGRRRERVGTEGRGLLTVRKFACAGHLHVSAPGTGAVLFRRTAPVPGAATWEGLGRRKYRVGTEDLGLLTVRKFACAGHLHVSAPGTGAVLFRRTAPVPGAATW